MLYYLTYIAVQELFRETQLYWRQFSGNSGNSGNSGKSGKKWCVILALFCVISAFSATVKRYFSVILRYFEFSGFSGNSEITCDPSLWPFGNFREIRKLQVIHPSGLWLLRLQRHLVQWPLRLRAVLGHLKLS